MPRSTLQVPPSPSGPGFVKVGGILGADELDRFAGAVDQEIERGRVRNLSRPKEGQSATFSVLVENCIQERGINFIVDHPGIVSAVECLLGGPALLSSFSIHIKRPGWRGTDGDYQGTHERRHCDYKPFRPVGSSMNWLFTIIPLVECIEKIGPLLVSPGSHRCSRIDREGRVTKVKRAKGTEIPEFVDTNLKRGEVLFVQSKNGSKSLPGGAAQTEKKISDSNDDNVIEHLYASLKEQLGIELPWVSYLGDFVVSENDDLCRVYAYPELARSQVEHLGGKEIVWLGEVDISKLARKGKLQLGFELDAVRRWLHEPLLRGIGQSRSQVACERFGMDWVVESLANVSTRFFAMLRAKTYQFPW